MTRPHVGGEVDVAIVGSGFSALSVAVALACAGVTDVVLLESGATPGGTWRDNRYPGCACDVPSHLYSFSFAPKADWSHVYSRQPEIRAYTEDVIDRFGLRAQIALEATVVRATWQADAARWQVEVADGRVWQARTLVTGTGALRIPHVPELPGTLTVPAWHTAEWPDEAPLDGKRVAVVGTGASAIQVVPAIADRVAELTLFQRTPPWILPRHDRPYTAQEQARFARRPWRRRLHRLRLYWRMELQAVAFVVAPAFMRLVARWGRDHIAAGVSDPALQAALTPDFRPGCKRILLSDDYYPAVARPHVTLQPSGVQRLDGDALIAADGTRHEVDAVVWATGFDLSDLMAPMRILGREGRALREAWGGLPRAYLGYAVHGFPNLFVMTGPNTGLGHNSMIFMIEAMTRPVVACVQRALSSERGTVEVRADAQARFNERLQRELARTIWASGCRSWYLDDQGRNATLWPGFTFTYWRKTRRVPWADFHVAAV